MPENDYPEMAKEYIIQKFEQASQIRESLLANRRNQALELER